MVFVALDRRPTLHRLNPRLINGWGPDHEGQERVVRLVVSLDVIAEP